MGAPADRKGSEAKKPAKKAVKRRSARAVDTDTAKTVQKSVRFHPQSWAVIERMAAEKSIKPTTLVQTIVNDFLEGPSSSDKIVEMVEERLAALKSQEVGLPESYDAPDYTSELNSINTNIAAQSEAIADLPTVVSEMTEAFQNLTGQISELLKDAEVIEVTEVSAASG